ncbi:hypothetical protein HHK36_025330 [Tetracentron sinense]|uniref:RNase H type-1 domain-containing protein n=1 Tax=Tetracentron sinense TaxID=13715 RepID=A0A834YRR2_TETSI|nr:hypothetical protein HHK36_025330 [Tetracentron sinense]
MERAVGEDDAWKGETFVRSKDKGGAESSSSRRGGDYADENESPNSSHASSSSFGRKVARSRSVGCGSRSFSGDFLERISTGFGDCTLRRVESQREAKPKVVLHRGSAGAADDRIKERVKCGGIFGGFSMTSSSSSYWLSSSAEDMNGRTVVVDSAAAAAAAAGADLAHGRKPLPSTTDTARGVLAGEGRVSATKEDDVFETEHGIAAGEDNGDDEPSIEDEETSVQQVDGTRSFEDVCTALGSCNDRGTRGEQVGVCQDVDMTRSPRIRDAPDGSREMPPDSKRRLTGTNHFSLNATDAWNPQNALPQTHNPSDPGHVNIVMGSGTDHFDECYKPISETSSKPSIALTLQIARLQEENLSSDNKIRQQQLTRELDDIYSQEEAHWRQKSHADWLHLGDRNTKFFQATMLQRRQRNRINALKNEDGRWLNTDGEISSMITTHFTSLFSSSAPEGITEIINSVRAKVSAERNAELCNQFLGYLNSSNEEMQNCAIPGQQPWSAPERGWLKANVDGAALLNGSASGAGMVVRDSNGNMIFRGCKPLWGGGSRIAEVEAIRWSLLLALERGWSKLCIESDSNEAIDFLNGVAPSPHWDCNSLLEDISQLKGRCDQVLFLFTPRQANFEAHEAAQEALIQSIGIRVSYPTTRDHVRRLSFDPGLSNE